MPIGILPDDRVQVRITVYTRSSNEDLVPTPNVGERVSWAWYSIRVKSKKIKNVCVSQINICVSYTVDKVPYIHYSVTKVPNFAARKDKRSWHSCQTRSETNKTTIERVKQ
jgi:hypothetical protein